jgi:hypothetical protein
LGCGNGGLAWLQVAPLIEAAFAELPHVHVLVFAPGKTPANDMMPVATKQANMTRTRASLIRLLELYGQPGYRLTMLEIQKLAYFLQAAGEQLKLEYTKHTFGPYAETLHYVLQSLEGHYIRGYGDRSGKAEVYLLPGAIEQAHVVLAESPEAAARMERIRRLIDGFETPYGMELLASVHWIMQEDPSIAHDLAEITARIYQWNERKRDLFKTEHIHKAWQRLQAEGWLPAATKLDLLT